MGPLGDVVVDPLSETGSRLAASLESIQIDALIFQ